MRRLAPLLMLCIAVCACADPLDAASEIQKLRVLGIHATQPALESGDSATLSVLVVNDLDAAPLPITYAWKLCAFLGDADTYYDCDPALTFFTSSDPTLEITYQPEFQPLIEQICARRAEVQDQLPPGVALPDCEEGFPARARVVITQGDEELVAVSSVYLLLPPEEGAPEEELNTNPVLTELRRDPELDEGGALGVRCEPDLASLQSYYRSDEDEPRDEELLISWFVRGGSVDLPTTYYAKDEVELGEVTHNLITPDKDIPALSVWCVIRDGRGGLDWAELTVLVE